MTQKCRRPRKNIALMLHRIRRKLSILNMRIRVAASKPKLKATDSKKRRLQTTKTLRMQTRNWRKNSRPNTTSLIVAILVTSNWRKILWRKRILSLKSFSKIKRRNWSKSTNLKWRICRNSWSYAWRLKSTRLKNVRTNISMSLWSVIKKHSERWRSTTMILLVKISS